MLTFTRESQYRHDRIAVGIDNLVVAGWTGCDAAAIQQHIDDSCAIGVPHPLSVPLFYRISATQITQAAKLQALGPNTSGAMGGVRLAKRIETELDDPVLGRTLSFGYDIEALPVVA